MTKRQLTALAFLAVGVAALCYAARGTGRRPIGIVVAIAAFLVAGSLISALPAVVIRLRPFIGKTVTARAWGTALSGGDAFEMTSVRAIGPGLHIYLRPSGGGSPIHLKIAQPRGVHINDSGLEVHTAKYLQWADHKPERDDAAPAFDMRTKN